MVDILVRGLEDDVAQRLEERARTSGTSVSAVVREAIGAYVRPPRAGIAADIAELRPSRAEIVQRVRRIREMSPPTDLDSTQIIREHRDNDEPHR